MRGGVLPFVITLVACGSSARTPTTPTATTTPTSTAGEATTASTAHRIAPAVPVDPRQVCDRVLALKAAGCASLQGYELTRDQCIENLRKSLDERGPDAHEASTAIGRCYMNDDDCAATDACVSKAAGEPHDRTCAQSDVYGPVIYPRDQWERRKGATATHFSEVPSSKDAPIEVCGIPLEGEWLARVKCDDGSNPLHNPDEAELARVGNVGPGGRCNAIIDLYEVDCPEKTYEVFIDAYVCPADSPSP